MVISERTPAPKFNSLVSNIVRNYDPRFGNVTNILVEFLDYYGFKHSKIYFLAKEIEVIFNYKGIKDTIRRLPVENKLLLRPCNFGSGGTTILNFKLNNRGSLMIDIAGLNRIIMRSNLPIARQYQEWVYEDVFPKLWMYGMYINPIKVNSMIKSIFSNILYNHTPGQYEPTIILMNELEENKAFVNNESYTLIENDPLLKTRILNIAFMKFTGRPMGLVYGNNKDFNYSYNDVIIENPFLIAFDIGGPELVKLIFKEVDLIIEYMKNGFTIDEIEKGQIDPTHSFYNIDTQGKKYIEYQKSKTKLVDIDLDKINKEYRKEQESKSYGINIDEVVDK